MPNTRKSGFTIIDLMASLLVLALISVAATSALSVGKRIWNKIQSSPSVPLLDAELNVLRRVVSNAVSMGSTEGGGVSGAAKTLEFQALVESVDGMFALGVTQLTADNEGLAVQHSAGGKAMRLSRLFVEEISYFGRREGEEADGWHKEWFPVDPAPRLIRFKLSKSGTDEAYQIDVPVLQ